MPLFIETKVLDTIDHQLIIFVQKQEKLLPRETETVVRIFSSVFNFVSYGHIIKLFKR